MIIRYRTPFVGGFSLSQWEALRFCLSPILSVARSTWPSQWHPAQPDAPPASVRWLVLPSFSTLARSLSRPRRSSQPPQLSCREVPPYLRRSVRVCRRHQPASRRRTFCERGRSEQREQRMRRRDAVKLLAGAVIAAPHPVARAIGGENGLSAKVGDMVRMEVFARRRIRLRPFAAREGARRGDQTNPGDGRPDTFLTQGETR
jgi:hypothetical protein